MVLQNETVADVQHVAQSIITLMPVSDRLATDFLQSNTIAQDASHIMPAGFSRNPTNRMWPVSKRLKADGQKYFQSPFLTMKFPMVMKRTAYTDGDTGIIVRCSTAVSFSALNFPPI
jgi:hypothetical protein